MRGRLSDNSCQHRNANLDLQEAESFVYSMRLTAELKTVDIFYKTYINGSYSSTDRFGTLKDLRQYFGENKRMG